MVGDRPARGSLIVLAVPVATSGVRAAEDPAGREKLKAPTATLKAHPNKKKAG